MISLLDEMYLVLDSQGKCLFYISLKLVWPTSGPVS